MLKSWLAQGRSGTWVTLLPGTWFIYINRLKRNWGRNVFKVFLTKRMPFWTIQKISVALDKKNSRKYCISIFWIFLPCTWLFLISLYNLNLLVRPISTTCCWSCLLFSRCYVSLRLKLEKTNQSSMAGKNILVYWKKKNRAIKERRLLSFFSGFKTKKAKNSNCWPRLYKSWIALSTG